MVRPRVNCKENQHATSGDELPKGNGNYALARALNQMSEIIQKSHVILEQQKEWFSQQQEQFSQQQQQQLQFLQQFALQFQQQLAQQFTQQQNLQFEQKGCTYERFLSYLVPFFTGNEDPSQSEMWIDRLGRTYEICGCTEEQKVLYASYLFQDSAAEWWKWKRELLESELGSLTAVTWERFKKEFYDRYFPRSARKLRVKEFTNLVQGDMTVEQYAQKFMKLGRFAPHLIATEELRAERFQDGLQQYLQEYLASHLDKNFVQLVDMASNIERVCNQRSQSSPGQKKRTFIGAGSSLGSPQKIIFKPGVQPQGSSGIRIGGRALVCPQCNRAHTGPCQMGGGRCFKYRRSGYFARECPIIGKKLGQQGERPKQGQQAQARVYAITPGEIEEDDHASLDTDDGFGDDVESPQE